MFNIEIRFWLKVIFGDDIFVVWYVVRLGYRLCVSFVGYMYVIYVCFGGMVEICKFNKFL